MSKQVTVWHYWQLVYFTPLLNFTTLSIKFCRVIYPTPVNYNSVAQHAPTLTAF